MEGRDVVIKGQQKRSCGSRMFYMLTMLMGIYEPAYVIKLHRSKYSQIRTYSGEI